VDRRNNFWWKIFGLVREAMEFSFQKKFSFPKNNFLFLPFSVIQNTTSLSKYIETFNSFIENLKE